MKTKVKKLTENFSYGIVTTAGVHGIRGWHKEDISKYIYILLTWVLFTWLCQAEHINHNYVYDLCTYMLKSMKMVF